MTKTISLSDEAYILLKNMKIGQESFSEVIKRLSKSKGKLGEILYLYPELANCDEIEQTFQDLRREMDERLGVGD